MNRDEQPQPKNAHHVVYWVCLGQAASTPMWELHFFGDHVISRAYNQMDDKWMDWEEPDRHHNDYEFGDAWEKIDAARAVELIPEAFE